MLKRPNRTLTFLTLTAYRKSQNPRYLKLARRKSFLHRRKKFLHAGQFFLSRRKKIVKSRLVSTKTGQTFAVCPVSYCKDNTFFSQKQEVLNRLRQMLNPKRPSDFCPVLRLCPVALFRLQTVRGKASGLGQQFGQLGNLVHQAFQLAGHRRTVYVHQTRSLRFQQTHLQQV